MKESRYHFRKIGFLITLLIPGILQSQSFTNTVQKGYFRNPLGIPLEIVANMGELRANHWHMGLDIRTNQKENQPVYAAAEGYIAHIGIRPQSFGRYIVVNHPNGLSTLYAHLNDFFPALEQYVTAKQYEQETWAIELNFGPQQFPVTKGQFIAYSGNTGGSQGPHLHFEIFDSKTTKRLNPLLFGFPLQDNVPPDLVKLALYDRSTSVYEQTPKFFTLKKTDSGYIIPKMPVLKTGLRKLSFAIQAYDRISGSSNADGIFSAELFVADKPQLRFIIDSIDYAATAYMNAQIDYTHRSNGGVFLQHLSQLPGDHGAVYHPVAGDGVIELTDTLAHVILVEIKDAYKNISRLSFLLKYDDSLAKKIPKEVPREQYAPNQVNVLEKPDFEVYLPEGCLYDTIQPRYYRNNTSSFYAVSALHQLNDASIPLHDGINVRIKPDKIIPADRRDKIIIQRNGRGVSTRKAEWQGEWLSASFADFGTFQAFADILPPSVNDLGKGDTIDLSPSKRILFTPADNFAVKSFRAEFDSQWIRFTNDKGRNWIYVFDERCPYGIHHLKVTVEDIAGNVTMKSWWFKKYPYTPPRKKIPVKKKVTVSGKKTTAKKK